MKSSPLTRQDHGRRRVSRGFALFVLLSAVGANGSVDEPSPFPPAAVILPVAPWCAPCHGEIARVAALAAAARPRTLWVMAMEDGSRMRAMMSRVPVELRWNPAADAIRRARAAVTARSAGLPFAIATDAGGRICAQRAGGLDVARMAALVTQCDRGDPVPPRSNVQGGELLLPGAPRTAGFPFCCPVGSEPRYLGVTSGREALSYAAIASASLSLALV